MVSNVMSVLCKNAEVILTNVFMTNRVKSCRAVGGKSIACQLGLLKSNMTSFCLLGKLGERKETGRSQRQAGSETRERNRKRDKGWDCR